MEERNMMVEKFKNGLQVWKKNIEIKPLSIISVGRSDTNSIQLDEKLASRKHSELKILTISKNEVEVEITDCNSTHGTFFGKQRLEKGSSKIFKNEAMFSFGETTSFYLITFSSDNQNTINETEPTTNPEDINENKQEENEPVKKKNKETEKDYLDKYNKAEKNRSRLDFYKELVNAEKGFQFKVQGNAMANQFKNKWDKNSKQKSKEHEISWGMVDDEDVNRQRFEDLVLDPQIMRKIPGLKSKEHQKIYEFEQKLRKYKKTLNEFNKMQDTQSNHIANKNTINFEDENGYEITERGDYLRTRKSYKIEKLGITEEMDFSKKVKVKKQVEMELNNEIKELSILEDNLHSLIFSKNLEGKVIDKRESDAAKKKKKKQVREMYENLNFFDETEKSNNYAKQRKRDPRIQKNYDILTNSFIEKSKTLKPSEEIVYLIERHSPILVTLDLKSELEIKKSLCKTITKKMNLGIEIRKQISHNESITDTSEKYFEDLSKKLREEKINKLKEELM
jgi:pSer/pThr/pTyr-binding forkhead associated (FHA) protein